MTSPGGGLGWPLSLPRKQKPSALSGFADADGDFPEKGCIRSGPCSAVDWLAERPLLRQQRSQKFKQV